MRREQIMQLALACVGLVGDIVCVGQADFHWATMVLVFKPTSVRRNSRRTHAVAREGGHNRLVPLQGRPEVSFNPPVPPAYATAMAVHRHHPLHATALVLTQHVHVHVLLHNRDLAEAQARTERKRAAVKVLDLSVMVSTAPREHKPALRPASTLQQRRRTLPLHSG